MTKGELIQKLVDIKDDDNIVFVASVNAEDYGCATCEFNEVRKSGSSFVIYLDEEAEEYSSFS